MLTTASLTSPLASVLNGSGGTISADQSAAIGVAGQLSLINEGTIEGHVSGGGGYTIEIVGFWNDEITNNGVIIGDVHLGAGSDSHLGTGSVTGIAYGGRGRDNLVGSDNNDRLHGDEGNDFLEGGGGNDIA